VPKKQGRNWVELEVLVRDWSEEKGYSRYRKVPMKAARVANKSK